ncbi:MAG: hypothetical protein HQK49_09480 [Oligoflexia bacterium]|nr:hypothetical protein [Oligoflexia bacterium]
MKMIIKFIILLNIIIIAFNSHNFTHATILNAEEKMKILGDLKKVYELKISKMKTLFGLGKGRYATVQEFITELQTGKFDGKSTQKMSRKLNKLLKKNNKGQSVPEISSQDFAKIMQEILILKAQKILNEQEDKKRISLLDKMTSKELRKFFILNFVEVMSSKYADLEKIFNSSRVECKEKFPVLENRILSINEEINKIEQESSAFKLENDFKTKLTKSLNMQIKLLSLKDKWREKISITKDELEKFSKQCNNFTQFTNDESSILEELNSFNVVGVNKTERNISEKIKNLRAEILQNEFKMKQQQDLLDQTNELIPKIQENCKLVWPQDETTIKIFNAIHSNDSLLNNFAIDYVLLLENLKKKQDELNSSENETTTFLSKVAKDNNVLTERYFGHLNENNNLEAKDKLVNLISSYANGRKIEKMLKEASTNLSLFLNFYTKLSSYGLDINKLGEDIIKFNDRLNLVIKNEGTNTNLFKGILNDEVFMKLHNEMYSKYKKIYDDLRLKDKTYEIMLNEMKQALNTKNNDLWSSIVGLCKSVDESLAEKNKLFNNLLGEYTKSNNEKYKKDTLRFLSKLDSCQKLVEKYIQTEDKVVDKEKNTTQNCPVCLDDKDQSEFIPSCFGIQDMEGKCCRECLKATLRTKLEESGKYKMDGCLDESFVSYLFAKGIIQLEDFINNNISILIKGVHLYPEIKEKMTICSVCEKDACISKGDEKSIAVNVDVPMFWTCSNCKKGTCLKCKLSESDHVDNSCLKSYVNILKKHKEGGTSLCPKCLNPYIRTSGCFHITCPFCKEEFSDITGLPLKGYSLKYDTTGWPIKYFYREGDTNHERRLDDKGRRINDDGYLLAPVVTIRSKINNQANIEEHFIVSQDGKHFYKQYKVGEVSPNNEKKRSTEENNSTEGGYVIYEIEVVPGSIGANDEFQPAMIKPLRLVSPSEYKNFTGEWSEITGRIYSDIRKGAIN